MKNKLSRDVKKYLSKIGTLGGSSKSTAKILASQKNGALAQKRHKPKSQHSANIKKSSKICKKGLDTQPAWV